MTTTDVIFFWSVTAALVFAVGRFMTWRSDLKDFRKRQEAHPA